MTEFGGLSLEDLRIQRNDRRGTVEKATEAEKKANVDWNGWAQSTANSIVEAVSSGSSVEFWGCALEEAKIIETRGGRKVKRIRVMDASGRENPLVEIFQDPVTGRPIETRVRAGRVIVTAYSDGSAGLRMVPFSRRRGMSPETYTQANLNAPRTIAGRWVMLAADIGRERLHRKVERSSRSRAMSSLSK